MTTIAELMGLLEAAATKLGSNAHVYIDSGDPHVSNVEVEDRSDEEGAWIALTLGETVWS